MQPTVRGPGRTRRHSPAAVVLLCGTVCSLSCDRPASGPDGGTTDAAPSPDATLPDAGPSADAGPSPQDAGSQPPTAAELAERLTVAECGWLQRCRELELAELGGASTCPDQMRGAWRARIEARALSAAIPQAEPCQQALDLGPCWEVPRAYGEACWPLISHGRSVGEPCADATDCADGFCSSPSPGLVCGQCAAWRGLDAPCADAPQTACGPDAVCEQGRCLTLPGAGFGCAGRCQGKLACPVNGEGFICVAPLQEGDICELTPASGTPCPTERSLACVDHICETATLVALGEPCDARRWCRSPQQVCAASGRCELRPTRALGEPCALHEDCEATAYCQGGQCNLRLQADAACEDDAACSPPLACLGAPRTCQEAVPLDCR